MKAIALPHASGQLGGDRSPDARVRIRNSNEVGLGDFRHYEVSLSYNRRRASSSWIHQSHLAHVVALLPRSDIAAIHYDPNTTREDEVDVVIGIILVDEDIAATELA